MAIISNAFPNQKLADVQRYTKDAHTDYENTTDLSTKLHNLPNRPKTVNEKSNYAISSLPEDHLGHDRVSDGRKP